LFLKKRIKFFLPFFSVLLIGLSVGGATYALFTDAAVNEDNTFTAGTIILNQERDLGEELPGPMFYSSSVDPTGDYPYDITKPFPPSGEAIGGWAPGDKATRAMNLYNEGTLTAQITKLKANVNPFGVTEGPAYDEFVDKMNVKVLYPASNIVLYDGKLSGLLNGYVNISPVLINAQGMPVNITFEAGLDLSAGNVIQGEDFVFDFTFYAEQVRNNFD